MRYTVNIWIIFTIFVTSLSAEKGKDQKWSVVPVLGLTTETGLTVGGYVVRYIRLDSTENVSTVSGALVGTAKKQFRSTLRLRAFYNKYTVQVLTVAEKWKGLYFDTMDENKRDSLNFTSDNFFIDAQLQKRLFGNYQPGVLLYIQHDGIKGLDSISDVDGHDGGLYAGIGVVNAWDARNHKLWPTSGCFLESKLWLFSNFFGSDYQYFQEEFSAKHFLHIVSADLVWGNALFAQFQQGEVPFRRLSGPDGKMRIRGIQKGKYTDDHMISYQSELRKELFWRIGGVLYTGAFKEFGRNSFNKSQWKYLVGAGMRFALNKQAKYNLRVDLSYVDEGLKGTIYVRESF